MLPAMTALTLGLRYFAGVFAIAFALGTVRTFWVEPVLGKLAAVAIEGPIILTVSWWWGSRLLARQPLGLAGRAVMGGSAFVWLMLAELGLGQALGQAPEAWAASLVTPAGLLGLAGQLGFAALPLMIKAERP